MSRETDQEFRTKDMALAAFLLVEGYPFLRCEKVRRGLAEMIFDCDDDLGAAVEEYKTGSATVEPRMFVAKIAFVRTKLREAAGHVGS